MSQNLLLRGKNYSVRLFIPADLREAGGRNEIVRSTKTSDRKQARLLLRRIQEVAERLFFMVRIGIMDKGKLISILQGYIENVLRTWGANREHLRDVDLSETSGAMYVIEGQSTAQQFRAIAAGGRQDYYERDRKEYIQEHAKILLKDNAVPVPDGEEFNHFCKLFATVHFKALDELANRVEGHTSYDYRQFVEGMLQEELPVTLKQAVDEWIEHKRTKGLKDGTMLEYETNTMLALRFYGENYPVKKLNNKELTRYVLDEKGRGIKNVTLVKRIRAVKDVVMLACANHGIPPHTYQIELKDDTADVLPYTPDELNQCFRLLNKRHDWQYWAPLIGLLGGLRREEVVSLRVCDVKQDADQWYFDITDSKSDAGIRYTPVSDLLIQLGFLDFLEQRKKSGEEHLLMCWLPAPNRVYVPVPLEKYGDFFRNLRNHMKIEVGPNEKKDLHSLRHNYSDSLKQGGVRPDITDELCGHEHAPGSMRSIYDEKFGLEILAENLKLAAWKCDFSLLRTWKDK